MIVRVYITIDPNGDRPYASTTRPTEDRMRALRDRGCEVYETSISVPRDEEPVNAGCAYATQMAMHSDVPEGR